MLEALCCSLYAVLLELIVQAIQKVTMQLFRPKSASSSRSCHTCINIFVDAQIQINPVSS